MSTENPMDEQALERAMEEEMERAMLEESMQEAAASAPAGAQSEAAQPAVPPATPMTAQLEEMAGAVGQGSSAPISTLYGLSLPITIELGRTSLKVQEVLQLGRGSVIELDRLAGEPVDVFVGDRRFAEGEVVVLGESFGVRITRILPATAAEIG